MRQTLTALLFPCLALACTSNTADDPHPCTSGSHECNLDFQRCEEPAEGEWECIDIDECALETDTCDDVLQVCVNADGDGYACADFDECAASVDDCTDTFQACINDDSTGYHCEDVDECALGTDDCDAVFETCQNDDSTGFTCLDIDECTLETDTCDDVFQTCENQIGTGFTCPDVNECALETDTCDDVFETCANDDGTGFTCEDIDECALETHDCTLNDICVNAAPGWECVPPFKLFVTSQTWTGDLGGLDGADAKCQAAADGSAFAGGTYKAWLSDSTTDAADRLSHHINRYELPNGVVIANDWDDLTDGSIANLIYYDDTGVDDWFCNCSQDLVRTGTDTDGTKLGTADYFCDDYTTATSTRGPYYGRVGTYTDNRWTAQGDSPCDWPMRLICVETTP